MDIDSVLKNFRVKVRQSSQQVMQAVLERHIFINSARVTGKAEICIFCGSSHNLTKEHVLPRWTFEKCTMRYFITDINGYEQTYNKTTIPACSTCNNNWLSKIEKYIIYLLKNTDLNTTFFNKLQIQNIIRWFEIIDYKFQILNVRRKFTKSKSAGYIPYLADIPLSVMRANIGYSPNKAMAQIRAARNRITIKSKSTNENALIIFKTKNTGFYFFHHMSDFIYLELPEYKIAFFYFYSRTFKTDANAHEEAMKIIKSVY